MAACFCWWCDRLLYFLSWTFGTLRYFESFFFRYWTCGVTVTISAGRFRTSWVYCHCHRMGFPQREKMFIFFHIFTFLFLFFFPSPVLWRAEAASCWLSLYPQKRWTRQTVNMASSRLSALTDVWCFAPSCSRLFLFGKNWTLTGTHMHLRANRLCTTHIHMHTVLPHSDSWSFTLLAAQRTGGTARQEPSALLLNVKWRSERTKSGLSSN